MLIPETTIKLVTVAYASVAVFGAILLIYTAFTARKGIDGTVLRARAFLSASFLRDNGILLLLVCLFFLIHTAMEFNQIYWLSEESLAEFIKELTELGISICIAISAYKWFTLINPSRHLEATGEQESYSIKKATEKVLKIPEDNLCTRK